MYAPFFGLTKEPFSIAPDPRFLFMSDQHREALAHLLYGLRAGGGFVLLTGEIGAGKTTVFRCFLEQVPSQCTVAYVFNPKLTVTELLQTVCTEFGLPPVADPNSVKAHVDALNAFLLAAHAEGRQAILVIDEAQSLSADVLEQLRLLTNLETSERKLLQIVLIGQPELRDMLARPELEQLAQRVIARYHLGPLSYKDTLQYIRHRLAVAGPTAPLPFEPAALARIHALSGGVPRRINLLADRAMLGAYSEGQQKIGRPTVNKAAIEVFADRRPGAGKTRWAVAGSVLVGAALVAGVGLELWRRALAQDTPAGPVRAVVGDKAAGPARDGAPGVVPAVASAPTLASPAAIGSAPAVGSAALASPPAAASASAPAVTAAASPVLPAADPGPLLDAALATPATAWRELALRWNVAIGEGEPCAAVAQARLACFRSANGGLPVARQMARPGWVTLIGPSGESRYAVLVALDGQQATLQAGGQRFVLTLPALARAWRGDFATLWRLPPGYSEGHDLASDAATRGWLEAQLKTVGTDANRPLHERVWAFQLAQGLPTDGVAGPMTLMRLSRVAGTDEPRLESER
jgi:general secretion pathway protein A